MSKEIERKYFDYVAVPDRETRAFLKKRAEYGKAVLKRTAQGVWEMGQLLTEVKGRLPHGDFGTWIEYELGLTHHAANNFMRVFERFQNVNNLQFEAAPTVLYLLAAPSVSNETREEIIGEIQAGEIAPTVANIKARITEEVPGAQVAHLNETRIGQDGKECPANIGQSAPPVEQLEGDLIPSNSTELESSSDDDFPCPFEDDEDEEFEGEEESTSASTSVIGRGDPAPTGKGGVKEQGKMIDFAMALPLYKALENYGHRGHLFLSAATCWYELETARNKFAYAHSRIVSRHASGAVFDEWKAFLRIPDPELWEGCAACKGSTRVAGGELCSSCKGGFTTRPGEGVSADVVSNHSQG